jgi:hypothetical protein
MSPRSGATLCSTGWRSGPAPTCCQPSVSSGPRQSGSSSTTSTTCVRARPDAFGAAENDGWDLVGRAAPVLRRAGPSCRHAAPPTRWHLTPTRAQAGQTAAMIAAHERHWDVLELLVSLGSDIFHKVRARRRVAWARCALDSCSVAHPRRCAGNQRLARLRVGAGPEPRQGRGRAAPRARLPAQPAGSALEGAPCRRLWLSSADQRSRPLGCACATRPYRASCSRQRRPATSKWCRCSVSAALRCASGPARASHRAIAPSRHCAIAQSRSAACRSTAATWRATPSCMP